MKLSSSLPCYIAAILAGKAGVDAARAQPSSFRKLQVMSMDIQEEDIPDGEPEYDLKEGSRSKKSKAKSDDNPPELWFSRAFYLQRSYWRKFYQW